MQVWAGLCASMGGAVQAWWNLCRHGWGYVRNGRGCVLAWAGLCTGMSEAWVSWVAEPEAGPVDRNFAVFLEGSHMALFLTVASISPWQ